MHVQLDAMYPTIVTTFRNDEMTVLGDIPVQIHVFFIKSMEITSVIYVIPLTTEYRVWLLFASAGQLPNQTIYQSRRKTLPHKDVR